MHSVISSGVWEELGHFHSSYHSDVSDVVKSLHLIKMHKVVCHPEVIVVVHGNIKSLHGFTSGSTLAHGTVDTVLSGHELVVLASDLVNDVWGVDVALGTFPVDLFKVLGTLGLSVEVVEDGSELRLLLEGDVGVGSGSESVQPLDGEFV